MDLLIRLQSIVELIKKDPNEENLTSLQKTLKKFGAYTPRPMGNEITTQEEALALELSTEKDLKRLFEIQTLKTKLEKIDTKELANVKSMSQPPEEVENVMKAMLLLLGEEETGKDGLYEHDGKTTWKFVAPKLKGSGKDGILRRINEFNVNIPISKKKIAKVKELVDGYDCTALENISLTASFFFAFVKGTLGLLEDAN